MTRNGKQDRSADSDSLSPYERTTSILNRLNDDYTALMNLPSSQFSVDNKLYADVVFTVRWFRKNFDIPTIIEIVKAERLSNADELIKYLSD